jgi:hypothetical protein
MPDVYIPYAMLHASPITFHFADIPVTIKLCDAETSILSVDGAFKLTDASNCIANPVHLVKAGSAFVLEYKGLECEVRLGRRITVLERD